jgi:hypothetical protein
LPRHETNYPLTLPRGSAYHRSAHQNFRGQNILAFEEGRSSQLKAEGLSRRALGIHRQGIAHMPGSKPTTGLRSEDGSRAPPVHRRAARSFQNRAALSMAPEGSRPAAAIRPILLRIPWSWKIPAASREPWQFYDPMTELKRFNPLTPPKGRGIIALHVNSSGSRAQLFD